MRLNTKEMSYADLMRYKIKVGDYTIPFVHTVDTDEGYAIAVMSTPNRNPVHTLLEEYSTSQDEYIAEYTIHRFDLYDGDILIERVL